MEKIFGIRIKWAMQPVVYISKLDDGRLLDIKQVTLSRMSLGEKIREQRKKAGLSQEQLAEKLNVSRQAIIK